MGTRTITLQMVRSGIQISRRSAQRILRETKPKNSRKAKKCWLKLNLAKGVEPYCFLTPSVPNQTWHMDIMPFRVLWTTYSVVAILDGATRKLLCLRGYRRKALDSQQMVQLLTITTKKFGGPANLITDHGVQFRNKFKLGLKTLGTKHVRGQVRTPSFNSKVERFFKTLRLWQGPTLWPMTSRGVQQRLDQYQAWYKTQRPHQALNGLTPEEALHSVEPAEPIPISSVGCHSQTPRIRVQRSRFGSDAHLPVIKITVHRLMAENPIKIRTFNEQSNPL
ncbi:MAG: transposase [Phycisphaeraceae bacterium JB051]